MLNGITRNQPVGGVLFADLQNVKLPVKSVKSYPEWLEKRPNLSRLLGDAFAQDCRYIGNEKAERFENC